MSTTNQPMHYLEATKHVVTIIYRVMLIAHLSEMLPDIPWWQLAMTMQTLLIHYLS